MPLTGPAGGVRTGHLGGTLQVFSRQPAFACPLREMLAITEGYEQVVGYDGHGLGLSRVVNSSGLSYALE
jgi:hypothetical protein